MSQPYIGQIMIFGFNFAPRSWAFAAGQTIAIAQNQALFAILGTTYGGDGRTTFMLPNIKDASVMSQGQGAGLSNYTLGETSGVDDVTLSQAQMPLHTHTVSEIAADVKADFTLTPTQNGWIGSRGGGGELFQAAPAGGVTMSPQVISIAGGSQPHMNEQPYLGMNYCVALYGIFPSRN